MTRNPFDEVAERLGQMLPEGARDMRDDFERNARTMFQSTLQRMDLVTREEFDVQADVLARTREQLEQMKARVAALEQQAGITPPEEGQQQSGPDDATP
jgi:BMFP domain-containing protein YqiC